MLNIFGNIHLYPLYTQKITYEHNYGPQVAVPFLPLGCHDDDGDAPNPAPVVLAHCYKHGLKCNIDAQPPEHARLIAAERSGKISRGCVAGHNCYDWNTMGDKLGWLGDSATVFLQFLKEVIVLGYSWAILECTSGFNHDVLHELLGYRCITLEICPRSLGFPTTRIRKYMFLTENASLRWLPCVDEVGHAAVYKSIFHRRSSLYGDELLRAPESALMIHNRLLVQQRGLPATRRSGKAWRRYHLLTPAQRSMVQRHEARAKRRSGGAAVRKVCNLRQTPKFLPATKDTPALLRKTLFVVHAQAEDRHSPGTPRDHVLQDLRMRC